MENYFLLGLGLTLGNSAKQEPQNGAETSQKMTRKWFKKCPETKPFAGGQNAQNPLFSLCFHAFRAPDGFQKVNQNVPPQRDHFCTFPAPTAPGKHYDFGFLKTRFSLKICSNQLIQLNKNDQLFSSGAWPGQFN